MGTQSVETQIIGAHSKRAQSMRRKLWNVKYEDAKCDGTTYEGAKYGAPSVRHKV